MCDAAAVYTIDALERLARETMLTLGARPGDSDCFARSLVIADARGVDSHGIARLPAYARKVEEGLLDASAEPVIAAEAPATALVDARNGLGQVAGEFSMRIAIAKARESGIGYVSTIRSNHYGMAGYYAEMALEHGMIGISGTNSGPVVAPAQGRTRMLGTNPLAVAAPTGSAEPFLFDGATSAVSGGKLQVASRQGKQVPVGWGIDEDGHNATDPVAILARGSLLPLGSLADLSAHKGYGLAMVVEILSAMIGGDAYGTGVTSLTTPAQSQPALVSHLFAAIDIGRFIELDRFRRRMDAWLAELRDSPKAPGFDRIYIPGEKEWASERDRRANGVALLPPVVRALEALATRLGLAPLTAVETR